MVMLLAALSAGAQTSHVATLSHDGNISTFYSSNALVSALKAAVDGDIITLSSGTFTAPQKITKNVTIRGAGMILEEDPTVLTGTFNVAITTQDSPHKLVMEGLYLNERVDIYGCRNAQFVKCWFETETWLSNSSSYGGAPFNYLFLHCVFNNGLYGSKGENGTINNCLISKGRAHFSNSQVVNTTFNDITSWEVQKNSFTNCIIKSKKTSTSSTNSMGSNNTAVYCTYIGNAKNYWQYHQSTTNTIIPEDTQVFKDGTFYELLDNLKTTWLGNDGTQRGMYGSNWPFDPTTTNPRITKFNVAKKTTADGKLPVEIEVEAN